MNEQPTTTSNRLPVAAHAAAIPRKPSEILREVFLERKSKNSAYSTRAFARDLGMSQALVSLVFNGKRPLTLKQATQISVLLHFPKDKAEQFIESALMALPENSKALKKIQRARRHGLAAQVASEPLFINLEIERFKAISQWYHLAILDLSTTQGFVSDSVWISRRLNIGPIEARDAMDRLVSLGLARIENGMFCKAQSKIYFPTTRSEVAVRSFHRQMIGKALDQLGKTDETSFQARRISGLTIAIPRSRVEEAKRRIQEFEKELAAFATEGDCDEVYQLNVQIFPLTQAVSKESV